MATVKDDTVSNKGFALSKLADTAKKKLKLILGIGVVKKENIADGAVGISKLDEEVQDALAGVPSGTGLISRVESLEEHTIKDNETTQEVYGDFAVCANGVRKGIFTEELFYSGAGMCRTNDFHMEVGDRITGVDFESTSFLTTNPTWNLCKDSTTVTVVKTGTILQDTPTVDLSDVVFEDEDYYFEITGSIPSGDNVNVFFAWEFTPSTATGTLYIGKGVTVKPSAANPADFSYIEDSEGNNLQDALDSKINNEVNSVHTSNIVDGAVTTEKLDNTLRNILFVPRPPVQDATDGFLNRYVEADGNVYCTANTDSQLVISLLPNQTITMLSVENSAAELSDVCFIVSGEGFFHPHVVRGPSYKNTGGASDEVLIACTMSDFGSITNMPDTVVTYEIATEVGSVPMTLREYAESLERRIAALEGGSE